MLPTLTRSYPRHFTFYVAEPSAPFATLWTTIDPIGGFSAAEVAGRGSFALANQAILRQTWLNYEIP